MCAVPDGTAVAVARPRLELADIVRTHGDAYRRTHRLTSVQHRALRAIATCRTAALGGHRETCDRCGAVRITYNSCRNRHCPKCQTLTKERWLAARRGRPAAHSVLPRRLHAAARPQRARAGQSARDLRAALPRGGRHAAHLRARPPTSRRHDRDHGDSAHVGTESLAAPPSALSRHRRRVGRGRARGGSRAIVVPVSRAGAVDRLSREVSRRLATRLRRRASSPSPLARPTRRSPALRRLLTQTPRAVNWVVYAKRPFAGPEQVLAYLGRYTHRVALSNDRLVEHRDGHVRFRWKDYADHDRVKILTLAGRRIPATLSAARRAARLHAHSPLRPARQSHASRDADSMPGRCSTRHHPTDAPPESVAALMHRLTGIDLARCPVCGEGRMQITAIVVRSRPRRIRHDATSVVDHRQRATADTSSGRKGCASLAAHDDSHRTVHHLDDAALADPRAVTRPAARSPVTLGRKSPPRHARAALQSP